MSKCCNNKQSPEKLGTVFLSILIEKCTVTLPGDYILCTSLIYNVMVDRARKQINKVILQNN